MICKTYIPVENMFKTKNERDRHFPNTLSKI